MKYSLVRGPGSNIPMLEALTLEYLSSELLLTLRSGIFVGFKHPPTILKTIVPIFTIACMCILPGVSHMVQLKLFLIRDLTIFSLLK